MSSVGFEVSSLVAGTAAGAHSTGDVALLLFTTARSTNLTGGC
jgi:hypothetical protein